MFVTNGQMIRKYCTERTMNTKKIWDGNLMLEVNSKWIFERLLFCCKLKSAVATQNPYQFIASISSYFIQCCTVSQVTASSNNQIHIKLKWKSRGWSMTCLPLRPRGQSLRVVAGNSRAAWTNIRLAFKFSYVHVRRHIRTPQHNT